MSFTRFSRFSVATLLDAYTYKAVFFCEVDEEVWWSLLLSVCYKRGSLVRCDILKEICQHSTIHFQQTVICISSLFIKYYQKIQKKKKFFLIKFNLVWYFFLLDYWGLIVHFYHSFFRYMFVTTRSRCSIQVSNIVTDSHEWYNYKTIIVIITIL